MGEVMVVVARSAGMAERMYGFLNASGELLAKACGQDLVPQWWVKERRVGNKFTGFRGIGRCMDYAAFRWAAIQVGRRQTSFPLDGRRYVFRQGVPYVRYGDYESWPVIAPAFRKFLPRKDREKADWLMTDRYGCSLDAKHSYLYLIHEDPDWMARLAEAQKELGIEKPPETDEEREKFWQAKLLSEEKARPWCEERIAPLRKAIVEMDRSWRSST